MTDRKLDLTEGSIIGKLTRLALPIMGSSFILMAYNLFDMKFVGNLGYKAAAAVGSAGFFIMLSQALMTLCRVGSEVLVAQNLGRKDEAKARSYGTAAIQMTVILAVTYAVAGFFLRYGFIGFFNLKDPEVIDIAVRYMTGLLFTIPLMFVNFVLVGIFNAGGYTSVPFMGNVAGVIVKIISTYFLIYGGFGFRGLGVMGSVYGTILSGIVTFLILIGYLKSKKDEYLKINIARKADIDEMKRIARIGGPMAIQSMIFSLISIFIGRIVSSAGVEAISVQRIGAQIESVSWMTASGFSSALATFTGQNYGAGKNDRVIRGFYNGMVIVGTIGIFATILLMVFPRQLFTIFIRQPEYVIQMGITYLVILGISQFFQSLEIATNGAFSGVGLTKIPASYTIVLQVLRIPAAMLLMRTSLGISGIWWAISMSTVLKGIAGVIMFEYIVIRKLKRRKELNLSKGQI